MTMPSRERVLAVLGGGSDHEAAGRRLGIPPGLSMMIATGLPADGSDGLAPEDYSRPGMPTGSTQHLVDPGTANRNPTRQGQVLDWVKRRAAGDAGMRRAATRKGP